MPRRTERRRIEPLVPKTMETKIEEAKESAMEKMLDPKNLSPEKMPSFANLDSYETMLNGDDGDVDVFDNGGEVELDTATEPEAETEKEGKPIVQSEGDTYITVAPQIKKKTNNFENLKAYNKVKDELKSEKEKSKTLEEELEDVKRQLDSVISEKNSLLEKVSFLEKKVKASEGMIDRNEFEKVMSENEDLLLRNSELELEVSITKESLKKSNCQKASQEHTYSPKGYSNVPRFRDTRQAMNGYEDWV